MERQREEEERLAKKQMEEEAERKRQEEESERQRLAAIERERQEEEARKIREEEEKKEKERRELEEAEMQRRQAAAAAKLLQEVQEGLKPVIARVEQRIKDDEAAAERLKAKQLVTSSKFEMNKPREEMDMRRLIQQVPTDKDKAFAFEIDWKIVHDNNIIERKLRSWVKKKVGEYVGSGEGPMVDFILRKVHIHTAPDTILAEIEGFLDDEAENFTLKMWRMLIFEVLRCQAIGHLCSE